MSKKIVTVSLFIFFAVVVAILVAGLVFNDRRNQTVKPVANNPATTGGANVVLTVEEVAKHHSATDCWVIISGAVYNVTSAITNHSGGAEAIIPTCGTDATQVFATKGNVGKPHSNGAQNIMQSYLLGNLNASVSASTAETAPIAPARKGEREDETEDD